jgi:hypothetical protein
VVEQSVILACPVLVPSVKHGLTVLPEGNVHGVLAVAPVNVSLTRVDPAALAGVALSSSSAMTTREPPADARVTPRRRKPARKPARLATPTTDPTNATII